MEKKILVPPRYVPNRDDKYMGLAFWVAQFSKDPNTQMGSVIVGSNNFPLGYGYNGPGRGINDTDFSWERPSKYTYIVHSEENAIAHSFGNLKNSTIYVTGKPCSKCMLSIVNVGIKYVIYFPHKSQDPNSMFSTGEVGDKTDEIARLANVTLQEFNGNLNWMRDRINVMQQNGIFD